MKITSFVSYSEIGYIIETKKDKFSISVDERGYGYGIVRIGDNSILTEIPQADELTPKTVIVNYDKVKKNYFLSDKKTGNTVATFCAKGIFLRDIDVCSIEELDVPSTLSISFTLPSTGEVFTDTVSYITPLQKWKQRNQAPFVEVSVQCEFPNYSWAYTVSGLRLSNPPSMDIIIPISKADELIEFALSNNIEIYPYKSTFPPNFSWPIRKSTENPPISFVNKFTNMIKGLFI